MYWGSGPGVARGPKSGQDRSKTTKKTLMLKSGSVGDELEILEQDREIHTDPDETRRRRTVKLHKQRGSWGFTLQTYGIKNKRSNELEVMTYVDYVELNSPASFAGLRKGDVILSVNGHTVEGATHRELVTRIQQSSDILRLVVLFEDCCRKVELYDRFIKLKQLLSLKHEELRRLELKEMSILQANGITRLSDLRQSIRSSTSSDWDRFSVVSPSALQSAPNSRIWRDFSYPSMTSEHGFINNNSNESLGVWNDSFSEDSDAFLSSSPSTSCPDVSIISRQKEDTESTRSVNSQKSFTDGSLKSLGSLDSESSTGSGILLTASSGADAMHASSIGSGVVLPSSPGSGFLLALSSGAGVLTSTFGLGMMSVGVCTKSSDSHEVKRKANTEDNSSESNDNSSGDFSDDKVMLVKSSDNHKKMKSAVDNLNEQKCSDSHDLEADGNTVDNSNELNDNSSSKDCKIENVLPVEISKKSYNSEDQKVEDNKVDNSNLSKECASADDFSANVIEKEKCEDISTKRSSSLAPSDNSNRSNVKEKENLLQTKGDNSQTLRTSTEAGTQSAVTITKRFIRGVLLNDEDSVTKL